MSGQSSSSSSYGETDTGTDTAPTTTTTGAGGSIGWAPHGRAMTACLVAVNVALVALVYLYFWRVFSRKRAGAAAAGPDDDGASSSSSSATSASPSPLGAQRDQHDRLLASLPAAFVVRAGASGAECAVCIAELRDGDEARALPRCGHRFHAACVDAWLRRRHTTCPLCRASVVAAAEGAGAAGPPKGGGGVTGTTSTAAVEEDEDAPV